MTEQDICNLLADGERVTLECKKAQSNLPSSWWETYSAFANTYGGTILLGVHENMTEKDNSKRFTITGVEDADKICKDLWNTIHSREKVNLNLLRDEDVDIVTIDLLFNDNLSSLDQISPNNISSLNFANSGANSPNASLPAVCFILHSSHTNY